MKLKEIANIIEGFAPIDYASEWDNVGLMVGSYNSEINNVIVTLDVTDDVIEQAINKDCQLIISHHPLIFKGINTIDFDSKIGGLLLKLITNNISVYSCHTNMDAANGGINTKLAELFELENVVVLEENKLNPSVGIGRIGNLKKSISFDELCNKTKSLLNTKNIRTVNGTKNKQVASLCVASGSCGDLISLAEDKGADAIITADVKYHEALDTFGKNIAVIDAGHFTTEYIVTEILSDILSDTNLNVYKSQACEPFEFI